jgi:hypothetical protein
MLGLLSCLAMVSPACVIRARAQVRARPVYVVDEAPPAPRYRTVAPRAGYIWVRGNWEWQGNQWVWVDGHWERERAGYTFEPGHWEQRGNRWHWIEGHWVAGGGVRHGHTEPVAENPRPRHGHVVEYPTAAPPAPRETTRPNPRDGYIWIEGSWQWANGDWQWEAGHWERARAGFEWEAGRWERQGDRYVWVGGRWVEVQTGPKVRDHRHGHVTPPDAAEPPRHGHVTGPTAPPPAPRETNRPNPRAGYVWVEGRWQWVNGNWDWVAGHWERARAGYVWQPGSWQLQGGVYVWSEGQWVAEPQNSGPKVRDHRRGGGQQ